MNIIQTMTPKTRMRAATICAAFLLTTGAFEPAYFVVHGICLAGFVLLDRTVNLPLVDQIRERRLTQFVSAILSVILSLVVILAVLGLLPDSNDIYAAFQMEHDKRKKVAETILTLAGIGATFQLYTIRELLKQLAYSRNYLTVPAKAEILARSAFLRQSVIDWILSWRSIVAAIIAAGVVLVSFSLWFSVSFILAILERSRDLS